MLRNEQKIKNESLIRDGQKTKNEIMIKNEQRIECTRNISFSCSHKIPYSRNRYSITCFSLIVFLIFGFLIFSFVDTNSLVDCNAYNKPENMINQNILPLCSDSHDLPIGSGIEYDFRNTVYLESYEIFTIQLDVHTYQRSTGFAYSMNNSQYYRSFVCNQFNLDKYLLGETASVYNLYSKNTSSRVYFKPSIEDTWYFLIQNMNDTNIAVSYVIDNSIVIPELTNFLSSYTNYTTSLLIHPSLDRVYSLYAIRGFLFKINVTSYFTNENFSIYFMDKSTYNTYTTSGIEAVNKDNLVYYAENVNESQLEETMLKTDDFYLIITTNSVNRTAIQFTYFSFRDYSNYNEDVLWETIWLILIIIGILFGGTFVVSIVYTLGVEAKKKARDAYYNLKEENMGELVSFLIQKLEYNDLNWVIGNCYHFFKSNFTYKFRDQYQKVIEYLYANIGYVYKKCYTKKRQNIKYIHILRETLSKIDILEVLNSNNLYDHILLLQYNDEYQNSNYPHLKYNLRELAREFKKSFSTVDGFSDFLPRLIKTESSFQLAFFKSFNGYFDLNSAGLLIPYLSKVDSAVRVEILSILGKYGSEKILNLLLKYVNKHDNTIQKGAINALKNHPNSNMLIEILITNYNRLHSDAKRIIVPMLFSYMDDRVVDFFLNRLNTSNMVEIFWILNGLSIFSKMDAIPYLERLKNHRNKFIQKESTALLNKNSGNFEQYKIEDTEDTTHYNSRMIFRVFISSTFIDLQDERNMIHKFVYPEIKNYCALYGADFELVDLRWGITDNVANEQKTIEICLKEIKACQTVTSRPNFFIILGERYGSILAPAKIPAILFDKFISVMDPESQKFIKEWYMLDQNEIPKEQNFEKTMDKKLVQGVYYLVQRQGIYLDNEAWGNIENRICQIVRDSCEKLNIPQEIMLNYTSSATHQEIIHGVYKTQNALNNVHVFFRTLTGIPESENWKKFRDVDTTNVTTLKSQLKSYLVNNVHEYTVDFSDEKLKQDYLLRFKTDLISYLKNTITEEIHKSQQQSELDEEIKIQEDFIKSKSRLFVGRDDILHKTKSYLKSEQDEPLFIIGEPGSGKSAIMAKIFDNCKYDFPDAVVIGRFVGVSSSTSNSMKLIYSVCHQILNNYGGDLKSIPLSEYKLFDYFKSILFKAKPEKPLIIIIDAINQLSPQDEGRKLLWLPSFNPNNVKIICSVTNDCTDILNIVKDSSSFIKWAIAGLEKEEITQMITLLLNYSNRALQKVQLDYLLKKCEENNLPLYIKVAFEQAKEWRSTYNEEKIAFPSKIDQLIDYFYKNLEKYHGSMLINRVLSYLYCSRFGLSEKEIIEILTHDQEYFSYFLTTIYHNLPEKKVPYIIWSRVFFDMKEYLSSRMIDNQNLVTLFHQQFYEAIEKRIETSLKAKSYEYLADYYQAMPYSIKIDDRLVINKRKISELAYYVVKTQNRERIVKLLLDLEYLDYKCKNRQLDEILPYYENILQDNTVDRQNYEKLTQYYIFISDNIEKLIQYPDYFIQIAINQPNITLPMLNIRDFIKDTKVNEISYLEWMNKPQNFLDQYYNHVESHLNLRSTHGNKSELQKKPFLLRYLILSNSFDKVYGIDERNLVYVWDILSGNYLDKFVLPLENIENIRILKNDTIFIVQSKISLILYEINKKSIINELNLLENNIIKYSIADNSNYIALLGINDKITVWNYENNSFSDVSIGAFNNIIDLVIAPDGRTLMVRLKNNGLMLLDLETNNFKKLTDSTDLKNYVFSPYNNEILIVEGDNLTIFDLKGNYIHDLNYYLVRNFQDNQTTSFEYYNHETIFKKIVFSPDKRRILTLDTNDNAVIWPNIFHYCYSEEKEEKLIKYNVPSQIIDIIFNNDSSRIAIIYPDNSWEFFNTGEWDSVNQFNYINPEFIESTSNDTLSTDKTLRLVPFNRFRAKSILNCCTFCKLDRILVSDETNKIEIRDTNLFLVQSRFSEHKGKIKQIFYSRINDCMISYDDLNELLIWNPHKGDLYHRITLSESKPREVKPIQCFSISPNERYLSIASMDGQIEIYNVLTGTPIVKSQLSNYSISWINFSNDENQLIIATYSGELILFNPQKSTIIQTYKLTNKIINHFILSNDKKHILIASEDTTLKLMEIDTGHIIRVFYGHTQSVKKVAYFNQSDKFISISNDGTARLWDQNKKNSIGLFLSKDSANDLAVNVDNSVLIVDQSGYMYYLVCSGITDIVLKESCKTEIVNVRSEEIISSIKKSALLMQESEHLSNKSTWKDEANLTEIEPEDYVKIHVKGSDNEYIKWEFYLEGIDRENGNIISANFSYLTREIINMKSYSKKINQPDVIQKLVKLKSLTLSEVNMQYFPKNYFNLPALEYLNFDNNKLKRIPDCVFKISSLKHLSLRNCGLESIPETIGELRELEVLEIGENSINELPDSFGNLKKLKRLVFRYRQLEKLPESFRSLSMLEDLQLDSSGLKYLPDWFGDLKSLRNLDLSYSSSLEQLPESFGNLENLEKLGINSTAITILPESFGKLKSLKEVNLGGLNKLERLPDTFGNLQNLEVVNLNATSISYLPESFGNLLNLKKLILNNSKILNKLPESFGNLISLQELEIYSTNIANQSESIAKLPNLKVAQEIRRKSEEMSKTESDVMNKKQRKTENRFFKAIKKILWKIVQILIMIALFILLFVLFPIFMMGP